jgi:hypothetical protein
MRRIAQATLLTVVGLVLVYLAIAATLVRFVPTTTGAGVVLVKNNTYPGGLIPPGEQVLVSAEKAQADDVWTHLQQAALPADDAAVVEVAAGPYGKLAWQPPGIITVDGELTTVVMEERPNAEYLDNSYLATCISGACTPGVGLIFSQDNVYGTVVSSQALQPAQ